MKKKTRREAGFLFSRGRGSFTLTPTPFDRLTALSLSKGSPLNGEGGIGKGLS
jgi:hypothetical protein